MREIKFRAWFGHPHYSEPHMAYLDINDDFGGASAIWQLRYLQHPKPDGPIYMQYTGLKDKNGVEIYEGDVIRAKHDDGRYDIGNIVYGSKGAFCLHLSNVGTGIKTPLLNYIHGIMFAESDFEVIGNIYEHSHLLEAKNDQL